MAVDDVRIDEPSPDATVDIGATVWIDIGYVGERPKVLVAIGSKVPKPPGSVVDPDNPPQPWRPCAGGPHRFSYALKEGDGEGGKTYWLKACASNDRNGQNEWVTWRESEEQKVSIKE